jgi:putative FmdB family regulatory protein
MPVYEYLCKNCGPFTQIRAMSDYELPCDCPNCAASAPRVMLTAPYCSTVSTQSSMGDSHGASCSCCTSGSSRLRGRAKGGAKGFRSAGVG